MISKLTFFFQKDFVVNIHKNINLEEGAGLHSLYTCGA